MPIADKMKSIIVAEILNNKGNTVEVLKPSARLYRNGLLKEISRNISGDTLNHWPKELSEICNDGIHNCINMKVESDLKSEFIDLGKIKWANKLSSA